MEKKPHPGNTKGGAYILHLKLKSALTLQIGSLGNVHLPAGSYAYVGSARKSITSRVERHRRLAGTKTGKIHWHIDYLLARPGIKLIRVEMYSGCDECEIAGQIASRQGTSVPVPRFGSSDCRSGCRAHLFRVKDFSFLLSTTVACAGPDL